MPVEREVLGRRNQQLEPWREPCSPSPAGKLAGQGREVPGGGARRENDKGLVRAIWGFARDDEWAPVQTW